MIDSDRSIRAYQDKPKVKLYSHNWNLPTWTYIEPVADAEGDAVQLRNALTSPRRLHSARGGDWEETAEEIIADNIYAIERAAKQAAEFNTANPTSPPLTWRDLIPLVMPQGQTLSLQDPAIVEAQSAASTEEALAGALPTGEMANLSTLQFTRNRKAIKKILEELAKGETSESAARVYLGGIGLTEASVNALIADAVDGSVDTPELKDKPEAIPAIQSGEADRKLGIEEALQKIYLSVGKVITADEAREIIELKYGVDLPPNTLPNAEATSG